ncbi:MAG: DUF1540 domain-containing protein [Defluviitaleaceae bacterium]|nr:DUF1540 domain-containing protein [Defluviitaleaceae bacterium]
MSNQQINCTVESCKFNDHQKHCALNTITVGSETATQPKNECDTICSSFSKQ